MNTKCLLARLFVLFCFSGSLNAFASHLAEPMDRWFHSIDQEKQEAQKYFAKCSTENFKSILAKFTQYSLYYSLYQFEENIIFPDCEDEKFFPKKEKMRNFFFKAQVRVAAIANEQVSYGISSCSNSS